MVPLEESSVRGFSGVPLSRITSTTIPTTEQITIPATGPTDLSTRTLGVPHSNVQSMFSHMRHIPSTVSLAIKRPDTATTPRVITTTYRTTRTNHAQCAGILNIPRCHGTITSCSTHIGKLACSPRARVRTISNTAVNLFLTLGTIMNANSRIVVPSPFFASCSTRIVLYNNHPIAITLHPRRNVHIGTTSVRTTVAPHAHTMVVGSPNGPANTMASTTRLTHVTRMYGRRGV